MTCSPKREAEQCHCAEDLKHVAAEDNMTAVEAIGDVPGGKEEKKAGEEERQARISEIKRAMGNGINLPGHRNSLRLRTQDHGNAG